MTVLGIETATQVCGAALIRDGSVIAERSVNERNVHAERVMGLIGQVTADGGGLRDVDGIAVSIGPGSFTGLRIGASVAKGLAFGGEKAVVGVPTLQALLEHARRTSRLAAGARELMAVIPARRGEYYTLRESVPDVRILDTPSLSSECLREGLMLTGEFGAKGNTGSGMDGIPVVEVFARCCSPSAVALLGERMLREGRHDDLATLEPRYLLDFFQSVDKMERT
jgi:tRNA threonylcarbamoyladenosine biosynthesis protein TsaB